MAFSDPIVGTEVLIRNQMQSEGFSVDPETGVTGWQIKKDGTATFNNLIIGGTNYNIDNAGNATFEGVTANTSFIYQGTELSDLLAPFPKGLIVATTLTNSGPWNGSTSLLVGRLIIPNYDVSRSYLVGIHTRINVASSTGTFMDLTVRYAWDADTTASSTELVDFQAGARDSTSTNDSGLAAQRPISFATAGGTDLHLGAYVNFSSTFNDFAGGAGNPELDSGHTAVMWVEDMGPITAFTAWDGGGGSGGGNPPQQYTKTYSCLDSASFDSSGNNRSGFDSGHCFQGYYSATNGNQFSLITFPYSSIASDLSGATIDKVEVYLDNIHWYNNSGGTAIIGTHTYATVTGDANYANVDPNISSSSFTYGQAKWVTVSNSIGTAFKNGTAKGIALGKGPSTSHTYYGYFSGFGQSGAPKLRITYTK